MIQSLRCWRKRVAPSLCALVASAGVAAKAEDGPTLAAPAPLAISGPISPIVPAAHLADDDDPPPPPPPFESAPLDQGRRAPRGISLAPPTAPALAPPAALGEDEPAPALSADDSSAPVTLPEDIGHRAHGLIPPAAKGLDELEDVHIAAPVPAEAPETELVQERYPNGSLKLAREVTQDGQGNFVNHGSWKEWNLQGELIAEGVYKHGVRHGVWRRVLDAKDSPLFSTTPYNQFKGPFVSQVELENGRLHGAWIIADAHGRKISEIPFADGARHGMASWYHANGRKMQQMTFLKGSVEGEILTWRVDGALSAKEEYHGARKLESKTEYYAQNRRKSTGDYLSPKMVVAKEDDWWNCRLATFTAEGEAERHGPWKAWHQNGQVQVEGRFHYGQPEGEFTWYYANGQKSAEGAYRHGDRHGTWTWWHDNGLKSSLGEFADGKPAGHWTWWNADGKVAQKADFADGIPTQALETRRPTIQATLPAPSRKP